MSKQKFKGNPPDGGIAIGEVDGMTLYNIPKYTTKDFFGFKLVANKPRKEKANYWLSWSRSMKRFTKGGDNWTLVKNDPEIADAITSMAEMFAKAADDN